MVILVKLEVFFAMICLFTKWHFFSYPIIDNANKFIESANVIEPLTYFVFLNNFGKLKTKKNFIFININYIQ